MSEIHTSTPVKAPGAHLLGHLRVALGVAMALSFGLSPMALADGEQSLQNVTVDSHRQLVVKFAPGGGAPQSPRLTEVKSPNHQLYIEFSGASLDDTTVPAGDQLTRLLASKMPGVKRAGIGIVSNATAPTVRVVLELDPDLVISPSVSSLQDGAAVISLGSDYSATVGSASSGIPTAEEGIKPFVASDPELAEASTPTASPSNSSDPAAAYEEYYRKFLQQKQLTDSTVPKGEWGPRKGTAAEAAVVKKNGIRIIGTPLNNPALEDLPESVKAAAYPPIKRNPATAAKAPKPAAAAPEQLAEEPKPAATPAPAAAAVEAEEPAPAAVENTAAQPTEVEAAPPPVARKKAPVAEPQTAEAPAQSEEPAPQAQPDMVAGGENASEPAAAPTAAEPVEQAPSAPVKHQVATPRTVKTAAATGVRKVAKPAPELTPEEENAAPAAANAGADESQATEGEQAAAGTDSPKMRAAKLFNSAVKNHMQGRVAQAIEQYKQALKLDDELGCAHGNLGLAYNQQHNYESALGEFHKALAVNARDAITYNGMGAALRAQHDMPGAIKNWQRAVKIDPKLTVAHFNLGTAYDLEGQYEQAMESYQTAVTLDPKFGEAYYRMGLIMQKRKRFQDAKANFKKALNVSAEADYSADARLKIAAIEKISK